MSTLKSFKILSEFSESAIESPGGIINEWISTGNYIFNAHISGSLMKGVPAGRIVTVAGEPKTGKSYILRNSMREAQARGYMVWLFETEGAYESKGLAKWGIDISEDKFRFTQPDTIEDVVVSTTQFLVQYEKDKADWKGDPSDFPKVAIFIDSLTALLPKKYAKDAMEGKLVSDQGFQARELGVLMRLLSVKCARLGVPVMCAAHIYQSQAGFTNVDRVSGGMKVIFMSSIVVILKKLVKKEKGTDTQGDFARVPQGALVRSELLEGRFAQPKPVAFYIDFKKGMNPYIGLHNYLSWETCGIAKGRYGDLVNIVYELAYKGALDKTNIVGFEFDMGFLKQNLSKAKFNNVDSYLNWLFDNGLAVNLGGNKFKFTKKAIDGFKEDGTYPKPGADEKCAILNNNSNTWAVRHLQETIEGIDLYSPRVFTEDVLRGIDENHIRAEFEFNDDSFVAEPDIDSLFSQSE